MLLAKPLPEIVKQLVQRLSIVQNALCPVFYPFVLRLAEASVAPYVVAHQELVGLFVPSSVAQRTARYSS